MNDSESGANERAETPAAEHLDRLEQQHRDEEHAEAGRDLRTHPRPLAVLRPPGGRLPASEAWLARLYAQGRIVREKKPPVFDHLRSVGPWFASVDEPPMSVLDGMSQTATVCSGFAEDPVVRAYVEGDFGDTIVHGDDPGRVPHDAADRFAERLRELVPALPHVSFVASGAEACEKALALCRLQAASDSQRRVLAFEGSFHGRTLMALHASYNPAKRAPFEIAGHEVTYAPFPLWQSPHDAEPAAPEGFLEAIATGDVEAARRHFDPEDALLAAELESLDAVHTHLSAGEHFAVIVEPMQSEGGDRYATARFFRALRLLTRHHDVPLVFDEVQTGFGLGGEFAWHTRFELVDAEGRRDGPDCVTFAKRAQVGVVMSRFADPEPSSAHPASIVRGLVHANLMAADWEAEGVQRLVRQHLAELQERFPELVENPRATGYAFAFELPSPEHLAAYLKQRFWRGAIIFGAGTRTVRYRLSKGFDQRTMGLLFEAVQQSLEWLATRPGETPPDWEDVPTPRRHPPRTTRDVETRVRRLASAEEEREALPAVLALEREVYEPARRDPPERLRTAFDDPDGIAIVAEAYEDGEWELAGYCLSVPLEHVAEVGGPDRDPMRGRNNTLYSVALTVDPKYQGRGLGRRLKRAQLEAALEMRWPDGSPRYRHVSGRNRLVLADNMVRLNRAFGGYGLFRLQGIYEDPEAEAWYYRMPLGPFVVDAPQGDDVSPRARPAEGVDLACGISRPFAEAPSSLRQDTGRGGMFGPAVHKITLCNYVTPGVVRAVEWVGALTPRLPHLYLTSSRDESFDKTVRALKWHRPKGRVVLGLEGGYVGHTTAAARSLSDPRTHRQGLGYFDGWPRLPHPDEAGVEETVDAARRAIEAAGGPEQVLGLFLEPVQERTGRVAPDALWPALERLRGDTGVPVVLVETASAAYRSGRGPFHASESGFVPDALTWWGGGQIGFVHAGDSLFVDKPLTLVSTWDGDELSLVRVHHQLRAARHVDVAGRAERIDQALEPARRAGLPVRGCGLYRVIAAGDRASAIRSALSSRSLRVDELPGGHIAVAPTLDVTDGALERLEVALGEACA